MQKIKLFLRILGSPTSIILTISLVLAMFSLYMTYRIRPFTSDDVSWQAILLSWHPFGGQITLGSSDNFVDKLPYFAFFNHFFSPGRRLVLIESAILEVVSLGSLFAAAIYFLKRAGGKLNYLNLLPLVWLGSFGYAFAQLYLNSEWRGAETGLSFLLFALVAAYYAGRSGVIARNTKSGKLLTAVGTVVVAAITGAFIYSDPSFLYFTVAPLVLFSAALFLIKQINKTQAAIFFAGVLLSLVFVKVTELISVKAGIKVVEGYPVQFVGFNDLISNAKLAVHGILLIFGADFFGRKVASLGAVTAVVNAALVGYIFYRLYRWCKRPWAYISTPARLWKTFFAGLVVLSILFYSFSNVAVDLNTYRYFFMLVLAAAVFLVLDLADTAATQKNILAGLLVLATLLNIVSAIHGDGDLTQVPAVTNRANSANFALIHTVQAQGLTKGYTNYWDSDLDTYLSKNTITFLPVFCNGTQTARHYWLVDERRFNERATRSFYVINPDYTVPPACTKDQLLRQFGTPEQTIQQGNKTILIYSYDIGKKM